MQLVIGRLAEKSVSKEIACKMFSGDDPLTTMVRLPQRNLSIQSLGNY